MMRWLACCVVVAGCLRARATVVHPTSYERTTGGAGSGSTIARELPTGELPQASQVPETADPNPNLGSLEVGALVPFTLPSARVHIAPGVRIFNSHPDAPLFGVAVGADFLGNRRTGFALEGSIHAGDSSSDLTVVEQVLDVFAGVTVHSGRTATSVAVGPSLGVLGLPGGHSVVIVGLGLRVTGGQSR